MGVIPKLVSGIERSFDPVNNPCQQVEGTDTYSNLWKLKQGSASVNVRWERATWNRVTRKQALQQRAIEPSNDKPFPWTWLCGTDIGRGAALHYTVGSDGARGDASRLTETETNTY